MATSYTDVDCYQISKHREILLNALNRHEFADVTFVIGEQETEYNINRIFLSLISPVFKAMLYGKMKESEPNSNVVIKDMKPEIFESIITFAYCNDPKVTDKNVLLLLQACDKYQIQTLSEICHQHFRSYLSEQTFFTYFDAAVGLHIFTGEIHKIMLNYFAEHYRACLSSNNFCEFLNKIVDQNFSDFISICKQFLQQSKSCEIKKICDSDGFAKMELKTLRLILETEPLECSEEQLWDASLKWTEYQSTQNVRKLHNEIKNEEEDMKCDDKNFNIVNPKQYRLYLLKSVKDLIRFPLMDGPYFAQFVEPENIFNNKELVTILLYYQQPERGCGEFETALRINKGMNLKSLKYRLNASGKSHQYCNCSGYDDMIDMDLNKGLCTGVGSQRTLVWIRAKFDSLSVVRKMQIGSSEWPEEINGKKVQLKRVDGKWLDVMILENFKPKEIKTYYTIGTGKAVRIVSNDGCVNIAHWKFFSDCK